MDIAAGFDAAPARKLAVCLAPAGLLVGGLIALLAHGTPQTSGGLVSASPPTKAKARVAQAYGKLPLRFEQNIGQSDPRVKFLSRGAAHSLFLTPREAVLSLSRAGPPVPGAGPPRAKGQGASAVVRMRPVGASPHVRLTASERLPGVSNYLRGKDPRAWQTGVPGYGRVSYQGVYPGIDLVYHGAQGKLEYDFVVSPGADPGRIALSLTGARKLSLDRRGDLILHTAAGHLRQQRPIVYQRAGGKQTRVAGRYVLQGKDRVGFSLGAYDHSRPLVIDPVLVYSTYLGGNTIDTGRAIAVDASGNAYVAGATISGDFPTASARQAANAGGGDAFVTKMNAAGSALVYSTYLGGNSSDQGLGVAVMPGCAATCETYVTGSTFSTNFPVVNPIDPSLSQSGNCGPATIPQPCPDAFVAKLTAAGSGLSYSTYLGGNTRTNVETSADVGRGITVDGAGAAYVTGYTNSSDFPTTPANAAQPAPGGGDDAFVSKVNPAGSAFAYSTLLGGSSNDQGYAISVDDTGSAYVTGDTASPNFPVTPTGFQPHPGGPNTSAFVTKLNATGSMASYSTYFGNSGSFGRGIAAGTAGSAYVTGYTARSGSTGYTMTTGSIPTTPGAFQTSRNGNGDAFVAKFATAALGPQSLVYATYLGGSAPGGNGEEQGYGVGVDSAGNAYVTGTTSSTDFPTASPVDATVSGTSCGSGVNPPPCPDAYVAKLNAAGSSLVHSTYLGGSATEQGYGIAVDSAGNAYATGATFSSGFPTHRAFQPARAGSDDGFVSKIGPGADLSLSKSDAPDPVVAGQSLTYTLSASNAGPDLAQGASVRDQLPAGVSYVSGSPGCSVAGSVVTCSLGDLANGASAERQITVSVPAGAAGSSLSNTATVQGSTFDPVDANNSATATTTVVDAPSTATEADLSITKTDSPDPVQTGQMLTYTLSAQNSGPNTAVGVALRDALPAGVTFRSASSGCSYDATTRVVTCSLPDLASGASATPVAIVVEPTVPNPSLVNSATVSSTTADPVSTDNTSTTTTNVHAVVDVSVIKTDSPDPVQIGEELTYTLTARNGGPDSASGVTLQDQLPDGVDFVSASGGCSQAGGTVTCSVGDLASGVSSVREIVVRPTRANPALSNTASVQTSAVDSNASNDSASATTEVREAPTPPPPPTQPPATSTPMVGAAPSPPAGLLPGDGGNLAQSALQGEAARVIGLKSCVASVAAHLKLEKRRAKRGSARQRAAARRHLTRHARSGRRACLARYGRIPGQVTGLSARVLSPTRIAVSFTAPGTDGPTPPAARSYLFKQSLRAITTARGFARARTLCKGACRFSVTEIGTKLTLTIGGLRHRSTYYFAVAARDNVSGRLGPRSHAVKARTR